MYQRWVVLFIFNKQHVFTLNFAPGCDAPYNILFDGLNGFLDGGLAVHKCPTLDGPHNGHGGPTVGWPQHLALASIVVAVHWQKEVHQKDALWVLGSGASLVGPRVQGLLGRTRLSVEQSHSLLEGPEEGLQPKLDLAHESLLAALFTQGNPKVQAEASL
uniref:Putative secreted protein n=1 Tax=Ixodes ricinus TaxID=34613 RepID=A0A6B0UYE6_IXORI